MVPPLAAPSWSELQERLSLSTLTRSLTSLAFRTRLIFSWNTDLFDWRSYELILKLEMPPPPTRAARPAVLSHRVMALLLLGLAALPASARLSARFVSYDDATPPPRRSLSADSGGSSLSGGINASALSAVQQASPDLLGFRWVMAVSMGSWDESHSQACARHGLQASEATVALAWNATTLAAVAGALGLSDRGRVGCCVGGMWCGADGMCGTHAWGDTFHNHGWYEEPGNRSFAPIFTCRRPDSPAASSGSGSGSGGGGGSGSAANSSGTALPVLRAVTVAAPAAAAASSGGTLTVLGTGFGDVAADLTVNAGSLACTNVQVCHTMCRPCGGSSLVCGTGDVCVSFGPGKAYCAPQCSAARYPGSQCPCDGKCYQLTAAAASGGTTYINLCLNPGVRSVADVCPSTYPEGVDHAADPPGSSSKIVCTLDAQPAASACSRAASALPVFVSRGAATSRSHGH